MPKLPDSKTVIKILQSFGFVFNRQKGSHQRFYHPDGRRVTIVSNKKNIPIGTLKSISRQSGINIDTFLEA